jgi:hypothetical protein
MKPRLAVVLTLLAVASVVHAKGGGRPRSGPGFTVVVPAGWSDHDDLAAQVMSQVATPAAHGGGLAAGDLGKGQLGLVLWLDFAASSAPGERQLGAFHAGLRAQLARGGITVTAYEQRDAHTAVFRGRRGHLAVSGQVSAAIGAAPPILAARVGLCLASAEHDPACAAFLASLVVSLPGMP